MFPNKNEPFFGIFVKRRLEALSKIANLTIVSPQPRFPGLSFFKHYRHRKGIPYCERLNGRTVVYYPRFLSFPIILKPLDGIFLFITLFFFLLKLRKQKAKIDILDAHLAFPEGFACVLLGKLFKLPVTITLRGHDVNYLPRYPVRKRQVVYALKRANRVFAVANALRLQAGDLGVDVKKIVAATNGVETELFYPIDKQLVREKLGLPPDKKIILSIGYLVPRKGFDLIIDALNILHVLYNMTDTMLIILGGQGGEAYVKPALEEQICRYKLHNDVLFIDPKRNEELFEWYNSADIFCLASSLEGWPNVILESLACGVPVVAANVWGIPEIIGDDRELGLLVERNPQDIAEKLKTALEKKWNSSYIRAFAESKTWHKTAHLLKKEMHHIIQKNKS